MKKASAAQDSLRSLTKTYSVVPGGIRTVHVACVHAVALYGSELRWGSREVGRCDDLQLVLNRQARCILGALPKTPRVALVSDSGLTPAPVTLDCRQQRFAPTLEHAFSSKLKELHSNPFSWAPICRVVRKAHEHGRTTKGMNWPAPGEEPSVRTTILDDTAAAKRDEQCWARENQIKIGSGVWMWWTDGAH